MMINVKKISAMLYCTLVLALVPLQIKPGVVEPHVVWANPAPDVMLKGQQEALTDYLAKKYNKSVELVSQIVSAVFHNARIRSLSPYLVLAVIEKESSLNSHAKSSYGAVGLMQVVPRFHMEKLEASSEPQAVKELKSVDTNIKVGTQILADYVETEASVEKALKKYSGSASGYTSKVLQYQKHLENQAKQRN